MIRAIQILLDIALALATSLTILAVHGRMVGSGVLAVELPAAMALPAMDLSANTTLCSLALGAMLAVNLTFRALTRGYLSREVIAPQTEIELSRVDRESPDRVEQVGAMLQSRAADETVDIVDLVDDVIVAATFLGASDIHIEPKETATRIWFRIDGILKEMSAFPKSRALRTINRFRVMSNLDIASVDTPQDGRIDDAIRGKRMNLRISVFPTLYGPKIVIRLLDSGALTLPPLDEVGIRPEVLKDFKRLLSAPQGMVLFTGSTGSGKSTLMYSALLEMVRQEEQRRNIVTLEDPIERVLPDINQTQVDAKRGISFAAGLRTLLRQDPNVIMVGEIRDVETAEIALRAGQTGHLILSTLHTNSAAAAFARLIDMGIEPFLLASAITGVAGVRLVRKLCLRCRYRKDPPEVVLNQLPGRPPPNFHFYEGRGCEACRGTGFDGRTLVFELLTVTDAVSSAIAAKMSALEIEKAAQRGGMITLMEDGLSKVDNGSTSLMELLRVAR